MLVGMTSVWHAYATRKHATRTLRRAKDGDVPGAIDELQSEIEFKGADADRLAGLGLLYMSREDYGTAMGHYQKALSIAPERLGLRANYALCLFKLGRLDGADRTFAELLSNKPVVSGPLTFTNHAQVLIALGRFDEAQARIDQASARLKQIDYPLGNNLKTVILGEIQAAQTKLDKALRKDP